MVLKYEVEGYDEYKKKIEELKKDGKSVFVLFSGSKDSNTKRSWCPDCVVAAPVIDSALKNVDDDDVTFLYVNVGPREFWKDPKNSFRQDPALRVSCVPTLLKYGTSKKLEEGQCAKADMVEMLFEDA